MSITDNIREAEEPATDAGAARIHRTDVEAELARRSLLRLPFPPALEARYEKDMFAARAWTIRLTVPMGLSAYNVFTLTDSIILPDLAWVPMIARLCIITPVGFFAMWMCTRMSARFRENFIALGMTGTVVIPTGFVLASHGPYAPYTMLIVVLVNIFGNMTIRLRFHWAAFFSAMTIASVSLVLYLRPDLPVLLAIHLWLAAIVGVSFGLVANNQLERAERRSFLLALCETLRADQLSQDKAAFSALSLVDPLTRLANRRAFDAKLTALWQSWETQGQSFCLLMIDVDYFKRFNDHYGHQAGDVCLEQVARALQTVLVRPGDLVARYGGEEFAVLLADCKIGSAAQIAEEIRRSVRDATIAHDDRDDADRLLSVTIGLASADEGGTSAGLIALADRNLYAAKRSGRNRVCADDQVVPLVA